MEFKNAEKLEYEYITFLESRFYELVTRALQRPAERFITDDQKVIYIGSDGGGGEIAIKVVKEVK